MMVFGWVKKHGMPIFMVDPMPQLGPYFNQRAIFRDGFPRPVRWMPTNWIFMPVVSAIDLAIHIKSALRGGDA